MTALIQLTGLSDYPAIHGLQRHLLQRRIDGQIPDTILFLEHSPIITVGRARGASKNVLSAHNTPVFEVERGGDVTWHGPGQLVAYPIIDLRKGRQDLHRHLHALEDAVIALLLGLGLPAQRDPRNTGVWLPNTSGPAKKVCSIGIACRRWVTWHGLALNVAPDPLAFSQINPCGFTAEVMTQLADHLNPPPLTELIAPLAVELTRTLGVKHGELQSVAPPQRGPYEPWVESIYSQL